MGMTRWAAAAAALWLAGCAEVISATPDEVRVETYWLGEVAPGTRGWLSWLSANEQCAAYGRKPEIVDYRRSVAIYRCVEER